MTSRTAAMFAAMIGCALSLPPDAQAERARLSAAAKAPSAPTRQHTATTATPLPAARPERSREPVAIATAPMPVEVQKPDAALLSTVTLADLGFAAGIRFSNLGGRREVFMPMPAGVDLSATELVLALDDVSAHAARRSLEILVNDRTAGAIALDGKSPGRQVRVPLGHAKGREGFVKLTFVYSGAATQDRCIDVRYVGDSLTLRPETSVEIGIGSSVLDVGTIAALMPRDVAVVVSSRKLSGADLASALTIGRTLKASGRRVTFHHGFGSVTELARPENERRWTRGVVMVGAADEIAGHVALPQAQTAGPWQGIGMLAVARAHGLPILVVSGANSLRAARLMSSQLLPAARGVSGLTVGDVMTRNSPTRRITFDELALAPAVADVFGRADITFALGTRVLPAGTRPARLSIEMMVAPDGAGENAVVSIFVNDRLLGSTVAAIGEPTRLDLTVPDGMITADLNVRAVVQRRSAEGDCRFEPQGYPAQILGSSAVILEDAGPQPRDFAELSAWWADGIEVWLPSPAVERPAPLLSLITDALAALSPETAPVTVKFTGAGDLPTPERPFIAVSSQPPAGTSPRVHFDKGRVVVADKSSKVLLDLGGFSSGAVAQLVTANQTPGLWLRPLAADGTLPAPTQLRLDRGNVAFLDNAGIALAMSTERDTLIRIAYPDQVSWFTIAERFHVWIIGGVWLLITVVFLIFLQKLFRTRAALKADRNG